MRSIFDIARKDLLLLWRDKAGMFFVLVFPLIYGLFFGVIFSGEGGDSSEIPIAVVDQDGSTESRAFRDRLDASAAVKVEDLSFDEAQAAVRKGSKVAYVVLPEGFGATSLFSGNGVRPQIGVDPSRQAESGILQGVVMETLFSGLFGDADAAQRQFSLARKQVEASDDMPALQRGLLLTFLRSGETFMKDGGGGLNQNGGGLAGVQPEIVAVGRDQENKPATAFDISFPSAILWGVLGAAAGFAITMVRERTQGTLLRLQVAPISPAHVMAGKALACFAACSAVISVLMLFGTLVLGVTINNPLAMISATVCTALCFTGIMMLVSVLGRTEQAVGGAGWAVFVVMAMLGGGMIPLIAMPSWMVQVSSISPVKWGIVALEGAGWRGFSATEMLKPCGILLAVGSACFAIGALRFRGRLLAPYRLSWPGTVPPYRRVPSAVLAERLPHVGHEPLGVARRTMLAQQLDRIAVERP